MRLAVVLVLLLASCTQHSGSGTTTCTNGFEDSPTIGIGDDPSGLLSADLNKDGRPDAVMVTARPNFASGLVEVYLSSGPATFDAPALYDAGKRTSAAAIADVDSDGTLDIVVTNEIGNDNTGGGGTVGVLHGRGDGSFDNPVTYPTTSFPHDVAAADLDGDGSPDLAVTGDDGGVAVMINRGDGSFGAPTLFDADQGRNLTRKVAIGDFDGDGDADLVVVAGSQLVGILYNPGNASFSPPVMLPVTGADSVVTGDFDGDHRIDVAVLVNPQPSVSVTVSLWHDAANHAWSQIGSYAGAATRPLRVADVNSDGKPDLVATSPDQLDANGGAVVLLNDGGGTMQSMQVVTTTTPWIIAIDDFTDDQKPDLLEIGGSMMDVLQGHGDGTFMPPNTYRGGAGLAGTDLDGDGNTDLISTTDYGLEVALGHGNGTFGAEVRHGLSNRFAIPFVGDMNADGKPDVVLAGQVNGGVGVSILLNQGGGALAQEAIYPAGAGVGATTAIGDFNGDHKPDLVVAGTCGSSYMGQMFPGSLSVVLNSGTGTFGSATTVPDVTCPMWVATGDLDGDGLLDLVVTQDANVLVMRGHGDGSFAAAVPFPVTGFAATVALADLDGDHKLDVVVGDMGGVAVLRGTGDGGLASPRQIATPASTGLTITDFDGDGTLDLVTANPPANTVLTLIGDGTGAFAAPIAHPSGGVLPIAVVVADFDRDGHNDLAVANFNSDTTRVLLSSNCSQ